MRGLKGICILRENYKYYYWNSGLSRRKILTNRRPVGYPRCCSCSRCSSVGEMPDHLQHDSMVYDGMRGTNQGRRENLSHSTRSPFQNGDEMLQNRQKPLSSRANSIRGQEVSGMNNNQQKKGDRPHTSHVSNGLSVIESTIFLLNSAKINARLETPKTTESKRA